MSVLAGLLACSDATGPDAMRKHQGPLAKLDTQVDWYSCSSWDGGWTWYCDYTHTTGSGPATVTAAGEVAAPVNCSMAGSSSTCTETYVGGGSSGGNTIPSGSGLWGFSSGYCLTSGLCAPSRTAVQESDLCPALSDFCQPLSEEPPDLLPKAFAGRYGGLDGCPDGILTFSLRGNWAGEPALYRVGATRKAYFGPQGGFEEVALYGVIIDVSTGSGNRRYGGAIIADCTDGTFVGAAVPRR